ncbi:SDR family oxidoreductase [Flavobacterium pectinovorum]|uniref:SDR family NAD(P)-dependent oxidoreductase n=1 Tax=Flavobacterium pectinovorum TaxID=29533 RepID=UPI00265FF99B|nr:SDR family oxidoreductase [Flavobacterium pectinovorum]WKL49254.1 SDR family oxidoreductase [Flavobacterium pectinovorum]
MDLQLKGKTAFVSGSTGGIGYAIALGLLREGTKVYINGRTEERVNATIEKLKKEVPDALVEGIAADFAKVEEVNNLFTVLPEVDILINNVGVYGDQPFETTGDDVWLHDFEVNVLSGVRLSRHYAPIMKAKNWGRIIFISSESAVNIPDDMILYGVTKTAYLALSRGLAKHLKGTNVTVNAILPGPTLAEGTDKMFEDISKEKGISIAEAQIEFIKEKRPSSIIQRWAETEEVANMVVYIASPLSSATSGAALRVDGGVVDSSF